MVVIASILWAVSAAITQNLFSNYGMSAEWLVTIRLVISGILILFFASLGSGRVHIIAVFKHKFYLVQVVIFGIIGMLGAQYTFFMTIDTSNAAVATLLQYMAPVFITLYFLIVLKIKPSLLEISAIIMALVGTFLLLTNGSLQSITITPKAFIWGIASALTLAFYTIHSGFMVRHLPSIIVVGFGMLIGGLFMCLFQSPFDVSTADWNVKVILQIAFVIIFGAILPFFLFMDSMRYITPKESSLLGCTEPLSAIILSIVWLNTSFGVYQAVGSALIVLMVVLLAMRPSEEKSETKKVIVEEEV